MAQPTEDIEWATDGGADIVEPSSGEKEIGWVAGDKPSAGWFNWWMNGVYKWKEYLKNLAGEAFTWTSTHVFNDQVSLNGAVLISGAVITTADITHSLGAGESVEINSVSGSDQDLLSMSRAHGTGNVADLTSNDATNPTVRLRNTGTNGVALAVDTGDVTLAEKVTIAGDVETTAGDLIAPTMGDVRFSSSATRFKYMPASSFLPSQGVDNNTVDNILNLRPENILCWKNVASGSVLDIQAKLEGMAGATINNIQLLALNTSGSTATFQVDLYSVDDGGASGWAATSIDSAGYDITADTVVKTFSATSGGITGTVPSGAASGQYYMLRITAPSEALGTYYVAGVRISYSIDALRQEH